MVRRRPMNSEMLTVDRPCQAIAQRKAGEAGHGRHAAQAIMALANGVVVGHTEQGAAD